MKRPIKFLLIYSKLVLWSLHYNNRLIHLENVQTLQRSSPAAPVHSLGIFPGDSAVVYPVTVQQVYEERETSPPWARVGGKCYGPPDLWRNRVRLVNPSAGNHPMKRSLSVMTVSFVMASCAKSVPSLTSNAPVTFVLRVSELCASLLPSSSS